MRCNSLMDVFNLNQIQIKHIFLYSLSFESIFISCIKLFHKSSLKTFYTAYLSIEFAKHNNTNKLSPNSALIVFAYLLKSTFSFTIGSNLFSRASSPTSSVNLAKLANGEKYPVLRNCPITHQLSCITTIDFISTFFSFILHF